MTIESGTKVYYQGDPDRPKPKRPIPARATLPDGHDDADSPFFVEEILREYYTQAPRPSSTPEIGLRQIATDLARATAAKTFAAPEQAPRRGLLGRAPVDTASGPTQADWDEFVEAESQRLLDEDSHLLIALAKHYETLNTARNAALMNEPVKRSIRAHELEHTCPICGIYDTARIGLVKARSLLDYDAARHAIVTSHLRKFRSCEACAVEAAAQVREHFAAEKIGQKTRAAIVADALAPLL